MIKKIRIHRKKRKNKSQEKNRQLEEKEASINELYEKQLLELERLSGLTSEEAKELLLDGVKKRNNSRNCCYD